MNHLFSKKGEFPVPFLLLSPAYMLTGYNLKDYVKGGVKVSDGTTTMIVLTDAKDASGAAGADGVDDNDNSLITKGKAYELAAKELLAANQIGDTEGSAKVGKSSGIHFKSV